MRKLATVSAAFSGAIFLGHYTLPFSWLIWCAVLCALLSFTCLLFKATARLRVLLLALGLTAGLLWSFFFSLYFYEPAKDFVGKTTRVTAVVQSYPKLTDYGSSLLVAIQQTGSPSIKAQLNIFGDVPTVEPGHQVTFTATFKLADKVFGETTDAFLAKSVFLTGSLKGSLIVSSTSTSILYLPAKIAHTVSLRISQSYPGDIAGFMQALIIGDTTAISKDTKLSGALSATGTSHIVSVSGMNIAFITGVLGLLIKNKRLLAALALPAIFLFTAIVGFSPPVTRAAILQLFILSAPLLKREADGITALSAALVLLLLLNPFSCGNIGLQLSFAATLGIMLLSERLYSALDAPFANHRFFQKRAARKVLRFILATFATTVGALALTLPITVFRFGTISLIAPLSNIIVIWVVSLSFIGGIVALALTFIWTPLGTVAVFFVTLPTRFMVSAIIAMSHIPYAAVYTGNPAVIAWLAALYLLVLILLLLRSSLRQYILSVCLSAGTLCVILCVTSAYFDSQRVSVTALDVGQGQSIVITAQTYTEVIDCGSSSGKDAGDILTKYLQSRGRTTIDLLILTHFHSDHASGVPELLERNRVTALAVPAHVHDNSQLSERILRLAVEKGIRIITVTENLNVTCGGGRFTLFAPIGNSEENERGLTIICSDDNFDVLITGDMSAVNERRLLSVVTLPDVDVLVVGHHGSKYATSDALLDAVRPATAIISVGYNTYGHPAPDTLNKLAQHGISVFRTDQDGTVTLRNTPT